MRAVADAGRFSGSVGPPRSLSPPLPAFRPCFPANQWKVGDTAPNFSLKDQNGATVSLKSLQPPIFGKEVVLFFYPNDGSPGCTKQANAFRDAVAEFKALGAVVVGVSNGSQESHKVR